jgi:phosphatidylglycerophosphate synthase
MSRFDFPITRYLSGILLPAFLRVRITPNTVTIIGLIIGLLSAFLFLAPDSYPISKFSTDYFLHVAAALLLCLYYILDCVDGEVARAKEMTSALGKGLDDVADWLVHTAVFLALGLSYFQSTNDRLWAWFGIAAAIGSTMNFLIAMMLDLRGFLKKKRSQSGDEKITHISQLEKTWDRALFVFRELFRFDFCFILLFLSLLGIPWLILPLAAVGAQFYWLCAFFKVTRNFKP